MRLSLIALVALLTAGCIIKDEVEAGTRELTSEVDRAELIRNPDGTETLDFNYHYGLGIQDDEGIAQVDWTFRLVDRDRTVLATSSQRMRKAQPEKTEILVEGDRPRKLEVPAGQVVSGETYILWIGVDYRDQSLGEFLHPVTSP